MSSVIKLAFNSAEFEVSRGWENENMIHTKMTNRKLLMWQVEKGENDEYVNDNMKGGKWKGDK